MLTALSGYTFCCGLFTSVLLYLYEQELLDSCERQVGGDKLKSTTWIGKVDLVCV